jgi:enediyne core biosynthesis thioesterase
VSYMTRPYIYRHRVTFDETNLVGNVYFAHYLHWQGHCRENFLAEHAPGVLADLSAELALVTVSCSAEFYAETSAFDLVEVHMTLEHITGNRIGMCFDYRRAKELVARGWQTIACMQRTARGLETAAVPTELRGALAPFTTAGRGVQAWAP